MYTLTYKDKSVKGLHVVGKKNQEDIPTNSANEEEILKVSCL